MTEGLPGVAREGDLVLLLSGDRKRFLVRLKAGETLHTHRGYIRHDDLIGKPLGRVVISPKGHRFLVVEPSLDDLVRMLKRITQIMYPKDIGYVLLKMNIRPGKRVIEAGTGSGALAIAMAHYVRPHGRVYSYEVREDVLRLARKNLERLGLLEWVDLKQRDIAEGFDETGVDACFLDVRTPWDYLPQVRAALKDGGFFGSVLPTANQVSRLLLGLDIHGFGFPEVEEVLLRPYKAVAARLRPADRMVAHTGFLVFARKVADEATAMGKAEAADAIEGEERPEEPEPPDEPLEAAL